MIGPAAVQFKRPYLLQVRDLLERVLADAKIPGGGFGSEEPLIGYLDQSGWFTNRLKLIATDICDLCSIFCRIL